MRGDVRARDEAAGPATGRAEGERVSVGHQEHADASQRFSRLLSMGPGALVGALLACTALTWGYVSGTGQFWERPANDYNAYLVAWQYFLHDQWRLPIFDLPAMGYPEGGSALFNDALPLTLVPSKVIYSLAGFAPNPFGPWIFLTYVLLGAFASRLVAACGVRAPIALAVGAFLAVGKMLFLWRLGHVAISSHFVIVWALVLYVENVRDRRFGFGEHLALSLATLLINAYLLVMVALLQAATVLTLMIRRQFTRADVVRTGAIGGAVVAVALLLGYGAMFEPGPASMRAGGFGHFSWNLATFVVPPHQLWGPTPVVRDATGGQYEGDGYIGGGVVLLVLGLVLLRPLQVAATLRQHWVLTLTVLACMAFAASNRVYVGSHLLVEIPISERLQDLASLFRASGRFIWVAAYAITALAVVGWMKWLPASASAVALALAASVTAAEVRLAIPGVTAAVSDHPPDSVDGDQMTAWLSAHERLFQYPSNSCGGLVVNQQWGGHETNRELRVQLIAARLGKPSNSIYTSRMLKDCLTEMRFAYAPVLEPGTLYMVSHSPERLTPALAQLFASGKCLDAGYTYLCSNQPLPIESASRAAALTLDPPLVHACPGHPAPPVAATWRTPRGEVGELHVGAPDGPVVGTGPEGRAEIAAAPGTVLYLMPKNEPGADALDVETLYQAVGDCAPPAGGRP